MLGLTPRMLFFFAVLISTDGVRLKTGNSSFQASSFPNLLLMIDNAGDTRMNGEWEQDGWHADRPRYKNVNEAKAHLQWSDSNMAWRMFWDDAWFGFDRHYLYTSQENTLTAPTKGWVPEEGVLPVPIIRKGADSNDDAAMTEGYFVFLSVFNIWDLNNALNPVNPGALLEKAAAMNIGAATRQQESPISIHHSEIHMCKVQAFSKEEREDLIKYKSGIDDTYRHLQPAWWEKKSHVWCSVVAYTGSHGNCTGSCCGTSRDAVQLSNPNRGWFKNASKYFYGWTEKNADTAWGEMCACGEKWTGQAYNFLTHNCNSFSSSLTSCVFGLSAHQPLGWSSMGSKFCCSASSTPTTMPPTPAPTPEPTKAFACIECESRGYQPDACGCNVCGSYGGCSWSCEADTSTRPACTGTVTTSTITTTPLPETCETELAERFCCGSAVDGQCKDGMRTPCTEVGSTSCVWQWFYGYKCECQANHCYDEDSKACVPKSSRGSVNETALE